MENFEPLTAGVVVSHLTTRTSQRHTQAENSEEKRAESKSKPGVSSDGTKTGFKEENEQRTKKKKKTDMYPHKKIASAALLDKRCYFKNGKKSKDGGKEIQNTVRKFKRLKKDRSHHSHPFHKRNATIETKTTSMSNEAAKSWRASDYFVNSAKDRDTRERELVILGTCFFFCVCLCDRSISRK
jgi:hypothetical protein